MPVANRVPVDRSRFRSRELSICVYVYVSRETLVRNTVIRHESSACPPRICGSRCSAGHEHDDHLQGSLARARNVVSHGERRPIARSGARSEAVPRARSGTSSLTVGRSPRADARGRTRNSGKRKLSTKLEHQFTLFLTQAQRSILSLPERRCDSEKYKIL